MASNELTIALGNKAIEEVNGLTRTVDDLSLKVAQVGSPFEKKFIRLRDDWKSNRGHCSDTVSLVMHSAYQRIIGMGPAAVPWLLRELASSPDRWFWALRAITEEDPVPAADRGNSAAMTRAWLAWGKERGYQW
jgi:hypothetical protein